MSEWICLKCHKVFHAGDSYAKCCGKLEHFDPEKHGRLLVGSSNAWLQVYEQWKDHPRLEEVSRRLINQNNYYGAAGHLNVFIEEILNKLEGYEEDYAEYLQSVLDGFQKAKNESEKNEI